MVEGPYAEGSTDHRGIYRFTTHGWSQEALVIVLNIIHRHHRSVPKLLDLEMLICAERWLKALQNSRTGHYGKASMLWLLVQKYSKSWLGSHSNIARGSPRQRVYLFREKF
ncbi:hypothetical protein FOC4_h10017108, partial [Fusarium odoratissimum]|uniref:Uncharacterized protein n=2 Tax=Fusarium oxysporum species complex TaxID=171631 RepID=N4UCM2_FUSC1